MPVKGGLVVLGSDEAPPGEAVMAAGTSIREMPAADCIVALLRRMVTLASGRLRAPRSRAGP